MLSLFCVVLAVTDVFQRQHRAIPTLPTQNVVG
jgi:hypothetical protein